MQAASGLYDCGRNHVAEVLTLPILDGDLLGSDHAQSGKCGVLNRGQYTEEHKEYWWIKRGSYLTESGQLRKEWEELWGLYAKSRKIKWVKDTNSAVLSQKPQVR